MQLRKNIFNQIHTCLTSGSGSVTVSESAVFILIKCASNIYAAERCRFAVDSLISRGRFCSANINLGMKRGKKKQWWMGSETSQNQDWIRLNETAWSDDGTSSELQCSKGRCTPSAAERRFSPVGEERGWMESESGFDGTQELYCSASLSRAPPSSFGPAYNESRQSGS